MAGGLRSIGATMKRYISAMEKLIRANHHCACMNHKGVEHARIEVKGRTIFEGNVDLFEIDHSDADVCYVCCISRTPYLDVVYTALKLEPMTKAEDAIMASIGSRCDDGEAS